MGISNAHEEKMANNVYTSSSSGNSDSEGGDYEEVYDLSNSRWYSKLIEHDSEFGARDGEGKRTGGDEYVGDGVFGVGSVKIKNKAANFIKEKVATYHAGHIISEKNLVNLILEYSDEYGLEVGDVGDIYVVLGLPRYLAEKKFYNLGKRNGTGDIMGVGLNE